MKFLLVLFEKGGCDYTIGCGTAVEELESASWSTISDLVEQRLDYYGLERIDRATIFSIGDVAPVNVKSIKEKRRNEHNQLVKKQLEKTEREEYERLKQKFDK